MTAMWSSAAERSIRLGDWLVLRVAWSWRSIVYFLKRSLRSLFLFAVSFLLFFSVGGYYVTHVILSQRIFLWADTEIGEKQPKNVKSIRS